MTGQAQPSTALARDDAPHGDHDHAVAIARRDRATAAALQAAIEQRLGDHDAEGAVIRLEGTGAALAAIVARS